jgi:hypothetical protein
MLDDLLDTIDAMFDNVAQEIGPRLLHRLDEGEHARQRLAAAPPSLTYRAAWQRPL